MTEESRYALVSLRCQLETAIDCDSYTVDMVYSEMEKFKREHPGAHFVIGDFEIKCLCPDKYHLP